MAPAGSAAGRWPGFLTSPARTAGGTRRYSSNDLRRLERISELVGVGGEPH
ncbi:MerR family transcriptional regulator [Prescottella agglutinans]|uniref:MerR family transcriptional regulator n=1 Tax=Prescottella agglutinans TaxID=1644129 RepID=UPI003D950FD7